ncbi:transcription initiation factor TFIID 111 kDa subunit [Lecanosticta acicola]|uniref:Transcription initiation factor TFIID 111 kDa subunit n=1 Tax=Lecanosticta acicola TaxID=111012 RepID=A0AAI8YUM3_9PEZI|nr:transcription initiation factor TFIID 111 kDa subunit [Lecanosticta acicola]
MPHATEEEGMESSAIDSFLRNGGLLEDEDEQRGFDQTGKDEDAVDYEDMSDDDLPEEEQATNGGIGEDDDQFQGYLQSATGGFNGLPVQPPINGYHHAKETSGDLFGDTDEVNDLFGDRTSSPEEERRPPSHVQPQQRPSGLALPSKSGLALPTFNGTYPSSQAPSPSSSSPPPYADRKHSIHSAHSDSTTEDDADPNVALQKRLLADAKRKLAGEDVDSGPVETDVALFNTLYPGYDELHAPNFIDLFPPHPVVYKGKLPLKPPKAVQPTKLSLDLLHDQERSFKTSLPINRAGHESTYNNSIISLGPLFASNDDSDGDDDSSSIDDNERIGGITMQDLMLICEDWDVPTETASVVLDHAGQALDGDASEGDWDAEEGMRPVKKRKMNALDSGLALSYRDIHLSLEDPERAVAKLAKAVALDLNDTHLLIDEHAPRQKRKLRRVPGDKRDAALSRDIAKRYNISNDQAYELLKENHHNKVRSTIGGMAVEHSYPATKLQYPFYRVTLDSKAKRSFHRPQLELKGPSLREHRFQKPKHIKRKNVKGREAKEVFAKAEDLSLGDNGALLLLEYSEEAPMMMSNFGMGNRLINYYRKRGTDDQERPKREIGEAQVLLTQDKSPFGNFGHVDVGETVPTIQNGLFRAPVFAHQPKTTDFVVGVSSTYELGDRFFLRNVENLHVVGQQFPLLEIPGQHSRKVTDAAKKRLRALSYRIYTKSLDRRDKVLDNATLMPHLPGHDMPQTRSKMREFMRYERVASRGDGSSGVWVPQPGQPVPDAETLRSWIRPEDVCLLDSMQVGVQHLSDLGVDESKDAGDDEKDIDEGSNIELQLAPWRATKNFLNANQGKAMLKLHGDGDPTSRGEGFSFVKTSMKGGFQAQGESVQDKINAKKRKETGGHSYNVAEQQKSYEESIKRIWNAQQSSLSNPEVYSDDDMDDEHDNDAESGYGREATPRSSFSTPAAFASRNDDDYMSQFSGQSGRGQKSLTIRRGGGTDAQGNPLPEVTEVITDRRVIAAYREQHNQRKWGNKTMADFKPTGDPEHDRFAREQLQKELARIQRNADRRIAREKLKAKNAAGSPSNAASPEASEMDGPVSGINGTGENAPQRGKGRSKDGTARKCANCGQVGHIKTNRKSVSPFICPDCKRENKESKTNNKNRNKKKNVNEGNSSNHGRKSASA